MEICVADLFLVCNYGVLPAWALLMAAPNSVWTARIVQSVVIPLALAAVYVFCLVSVPAMFEGGSFATLEGVMTLFTDPWLTLAGWVHYLAFDLFIGAWQVRDAARRGIRHAYVVPCLLLTLMVGPIGLGSYLLLRAVLRGRFGLEESEPAAVPPGV